MTTDVDLTQGASGVMRTPIPTYTLGLLLLAGATYGVGLPKTFAVAVLLLAWIVVHIELDVEWVAGFSMAAGMCILLVFGTVNAPHSILQYALLTAITGWLLALLRTRSARSHSGPDAVSVAIFVSIVVMALVDGISTTDTTIYRYLIRYVVPIVLTFLLARQATRRDIRAYTLTMMSFAVSQLGVAVLEMNGARLAPYPSYDLTNLTQGNNITGGSHRAEAMMSHPIPFSLLLVFTCCVVWTRFGPSRTLLKIAFTVACAWGVVESGSRSGFAAAGAVLLISILGPRVPRSARIVSGIAAVSLIGVYFYSVSARGYVESALAKLGSSGSYSHRSNSISAIPKILSLRHGSQYLFGTGIGSEQNQPYISLLHLESFSSVDNQFTSTLVWGGVVALVAVVVACGVAMLRGGVVCRALVVIMVVYMFSFDIFLWSGETLMLIVGLGFAANRALAEKETSVVPAPADSPDDQVAPGAALQHRALAR